MQKKIFALTAALLLLLAGCGQQASAGKSLYDHGLEVVAMMEEMASSDTYLTMQTGNSDILALLEEAAGSDFSQPQAVYAIHLPREALLAMVGAVSGSLSDALSSYLCTRGGAAMFTQVNAYAGAETLAAASLCAAGKTFVSDEAVENVVYLYTYPDAPPAAVAFAPGEDGSVSASGTLILYEGFRPQSGQDISDFFGGLVSQVEKITE